MKVAIYCRLSEEDRNKQQRTDDSESIQNQKSMLIHYAYEQGWEVAGIYSDDDYTGADRKRPEFNRLLQDAEAGKFNIVLCKTQSRFTRELELVEKYIHGLFPIWGIRFVSIVDNADTDNKGNKKSRQINGLVNEWYLEDLSDNIKSVLTDKRKKGSHIGAFALYGYKKDSNLRGHLIIDEEAASVVREIFTLFSQGYGKTTIARMLNDQGIPNPTEYKRLHGLRYQQSKKQNSTLWNYHTIASMLQNEIYIGNMVQGKYGSVSYKTKQNRPRPKNEWYRVEGTHEAIINKELWKDVQTRLKERAKPFSDGTIGLFAGKTKCAYCGHTLRSSKTRDRYYLQCPTHHISKDACIGTFISVECLEQAILWELNCLTKKMLDPTEIEMHISFTDSLKKQENELKTELTRCQNKINEYEKGIQELYLDKIKGIISEKDYISFSKTFRKEKVRLENTEIEYLEHLNILREYMLTENVSQKSIDAYTHLKHLNRQMIEKMINHIIVKKRLSQTRKVAIEIHWNF